MNIIKRNIVLKDVAKAAGVSISTASRVLNNEKFVSKNVREKVKNTAKKLNYEPVWTARSLRLKETNIIAVIIPNIGDYFFSNIVLGIQNFFANEDLDIILFNSNYNSKKEEKALKIAISKRVEGIILASTGENGKIINSLIKNFDIPFVIIDNKLNLKKVDFVLADDIVGSFQLVNHLIKTHGLKRIACLNASSNESSNIDKLLGYKKALKERKISVNEDYIKFTSGSKEEAYEKTKDLFRMRDKPQAIFCCNTTILIGCLAYLIDNRIKVPDCIAVVAFDDTDFLPILISPITTLKKIDFDIGKKAAEELFKRIKGKGKNIEYKENRIGAELIIRKSCGCNNE